MPLFPEIPPFHTEMLPVSDGHTLYVEQSGNPQGLPVIVLHGGPGDASSPKARQRFNPEIWHIIAFDQRGCGQSTPLGSLHANTTHHLLEDIETIRTHLGLQGTVLYGNSWGSTLALAYAQAYPQRVRGLLLGGIFTATAHEAAWFCAPTGLPRFFPQEYAELLALLGNPTPQTLPQAIYDAIITDNNQKVLRAVALCEYRAASMGTTRAEMEAFLNSPEFSPVGVILWAHYFAHGHFLAPDQLFTNMPHMPKVPTVIIHGELDLCCPPENAVKLHNALPHSQLHLLARSGHRSTEELDEARLQAAAEMAKILGF